MLGRQFTARGSQTGLVKPSLPYCRGKPVGLTVLKTTLLFEDKRHKRCKKAALTAVLRIIRVSVWESSGN